MKKLLMILVLGSSVAQALPIECRSVKKDPTGCYDLVTQMNLDLDQNTFVYSGYYKVGTKMCGWTPAGFLTEGLLTKIDYQNYILDGVDFSGKVTLHGTTLIYSSETGKKSKMDCTNKR